MYLKFENILDSVRPLKLKTFTKYQCPFFDDKLLRLKRKRKAKSKYRKSKTSVLESEYENFNHLYFVKFLEKRRFYIENALMENGSGKKVATLKLLLGQDVEQLPKHENQKQLANDFNEFFISKVEKIVASIPTAIGPETLKTQFNSINSFTELSMSQFRDWIAASSISTSPLDIIPTHLLKSSPDYYFLNLLKILNPLKAGCFHYSFKMAIVKPHLKKANSDNEDFSNYQPISNLSYISKLFERAASMQIREHLENNSLFSKYQSAHTKFFLQRQRWLRWQIICSSI